jgi:hypothetical protein
MPRLEPQAFAYSSFAPENPLLFRDSPFNEQILFLFIILLFSSSSSSFFPSYDNQLSVTLIKLNLYSHFYIWIYFYCKLMLYFTLIHVNNTKKNGTSLGDPPISVKSNHFCLKNLC